MPTKKVFIPNKAAHSYGKAEIFGELVFCTEGVVRREALMESFKELQAALANAESSDIIMNAGPASIVALACSIMASRFGELNLLMWDKGHYYVRTFNLDN